MTPIEQLQQENALLRLQMAQQVAAHEEEVIGFGRRVRELEEELAVLRKRHGEFTGPSLGLYELDQETGNLKKVAP